MTEAQLLVSDLETPRITLKPYVFKKKNVNNIGLDSPVNQDLERKTKDKDERKSENADPVSTSN